MKQCELSNSCNNMQCIHRIAHQFSDACKGLCHHQGIADCVKIGDKNEKDRK